MVLFGHIVNNLLSKLEEAACKTESIKYEDNAASLIVKETVLG